MYLKILVLLKPVSAAELRETLDDPWITYMAALFRAFFPPLLSLAFMMMASGLFNTFVPIRLEIEGLTPETIGIVTSALYLGILVGSIKIDAWILKAGHIRAFILFAAVIAMLALLQSFWIDPWFWSALRFLGGICMAGVFIVIESWLLMKAEPKMRGAVLSIYLAIFYAALSGGQFLINLSDPESIYPFCIIAIFVILSILPISIREIPAPASFQEPARLNLIQLFRISPLGFLGGVISGMLLAAVYGLVPVYGKEIGLTISEIGTLMAVIIFGGFLFQWPFGRWADKTDRRKVLVVASILTAFVALAIAAIEPTSLLLLFSFGWFFGGFSFALYPLSMAYTCEKVADSQIVAVTGGFVLSYGIGAIAGPIAAPFAMGILGSSGLFYFLAAIALALGIAGMTRFKNLKASDY